MDKENVRLRHTVILHNACGLPVFGIGYPKENELVLEQYSTEPESKMHFGKW